MKVTMTKCKSDAALKKYNLETNIRSYLRLQIH